MRTITKNHYIIVVMLVVGFICAGQGLATTYYVSTTGNNNHDGLTEATAFKTIVKGASVAYAGDTVMVKGGDYGDERIDAPRSGTAGNPIIFQGYNGRATLTNTETNSYATAFDLSYRSHVTINDFDFNGYEFAVYSYSDDFNANGPTTPGINLKNLRSFGRGGAIHLKDAVTDSLVESCYIEDTYRNSICFHGEMDWYGPCSSNTVANNAVVRGGHSSIDIHTKVPDAYVIGNVIRERGFERDGTQAAAGLYLHNHEIDRIRVVGTLLTDVVWGTDLIGANDGILAENLFYDFHKFDVECDADENPSVHCYANTVKDNIIFDAGIAAMRLCGANDNNLLRNHVNSAQGYESCQHGGINPTGNAVVDPMKGMTKITVGAGGTYSLSFSEGVWPTGTVFEMTGSSTATRTMGPGGADFGTLTAGTYNVRATLPGDLPAPQHVRVMPLPEAAGGAVVVWTDATNGETGFVIERKLEGESNFSYLDEVWIGVTRYVDESVGRNKATYRVRTVQGAESSACSNTDEIVRYGYWFTDRTGLVMVGPSNESSAFGQTEDGVLKTLVVEQVTSVTRDANAVEGVSSLALLESVGGDFPDSFGDMGEAEVWLESSEEVTATLRWRDGWIRGFIDDCSGEYTLSLHVDYWDDGSVMFNYDAIDATYDAGTGLISMTLDGSGELAIELVPEPATMSLLAVGGLLTLIRRRRK